MKDLNARQIIESLRTGVPIREAVQLVGSGQPHLELAFDALLEDIRLGRPRISNGFIYFGDFGTGKSHALEFFSSSAENRNFVVSRVTVSKNLQLSNYRAILSQLMSQMSTKDHREEAIARILDDSTARGFDFSEFQRWCRSQVSSGELSSIYESIALALPNLRYGTEEFDKLMSYLSGSATQQEIKKAVRDPRAQVPSTLDRTWQTLHFISNLFVHLGFNGWLILMDELELIRMIGSPSARVARGKSYAALASWFDLSSQKTSRTMATIGCMTSGFVADVIDYGHYSWNDHQNVPAALSTSTSPHLVEPALAAMDFLIAQDSDANLKLVWPDGNSKLLLQKSLQTIYDRAYETKSPELEIIGESFESIRIYIRRWIAQWDMARHGRKDSISIQAITQNFEGDDSEDE